MKKTILASAVLLALGANSYAQQDKLITHFIYDKMSLNPGSTGLDDGICGTMIYRNQWDKVNGAPNSAVFNVEANMNRYFPGGLGISFFHDAIGFSRQNNLLLNYSYPLQIQGAGVLGIGIGVGIVNFGMNPDWVPPTTNPDNSLPTGFSATNLDLNFGLYFKGNNDYYVGLSSTHLNESLLKQTVGVIDQQYQTARHYYLMGGKKFRGIGNGDIDAQVLMRTDLVKFSSDISVRYIYDDKLYGGTGDDLFGRSTDLSDSRQSLFNKDKENDNKNLEWYSYKIPWDLRLAYSVTYNNSNRQNEIQSHSVMASGNFELAPRWKVGFSSGYDFKQKGVTFTQFRFERDLESWRMSFNWVPYGPNAYWGFFIGITSSVLSDIKWEKRNVPDRVFR